MPQFTYDDRCVVNAENTLWNVREMLNGLDHAGAWTDRIVELRKQVEVIAAELREHNDQFEESE